MTPRERFNRITNHQEADRVPIDMGSHVASIHRLTYAKLKAHLNDPEMKNQDQILDRMVQNVVPDEKFPQRYGVDFRWIALHWIDVTDVLKEMYGDRICFHGAIDVQKMLPFSTPEEVRYDVAKRIYHLARGGGYILAPCHNIGSDVPPENVEAMYEAAQEYGRYPLQLDAVLKEADKRLPTKTELEAQRKPRKVKRRPRPILPHLGAYVGADLVGGLLATGLAQNKGVRLLVDVGTNGKIILGSTDRTLATAARPGLCSKEHK